VGIFKNKMDINQINHKILR